jgi:ABC-2 type transport system ATP-binding protein
METAKNENIQRTGPLASRPVVPMVRVRNLVKKYGETPAVQDVSFEIQPGSIVALLGPNGAGKTTTLKILTTLLLPTSGVVEVDGFDVTRDQYEVRKRFGIVFQDASLDHQLTAYENLDFYGVLYKVPRKFRTERIESLLTLFDLWDRRNELVGKFSGGMRRRLEIARCLLHTPKIIFMDEPTIGLDPQTRNHLWNQLRILNERDNVTVLLTTHHMEEAEQVAQWVLIIDHGKIIAQGTVKHIQEQTDSKTLTQAFIALTGNKNTFRRS